MPRDHRPVPAEPPGYHCRTCPTLCASVWQGQWAQTADLIQGHKQTEQYKRNSWLFHNDDPIRNLYVLQSGAILLRRVDSRGDSRAVQLATQGAVIGFRCFLNGPNHLLSAQCLTNSVLCRIPVACLDQVFQANHGLEQFFFRHLADDLRHNESRVLHMATLGVRERMILLIDELGKSFGQPRDNGAWLIANPLSRVDMGVLAGMTPETVSRCLKGLEAEGMAYFSRRHILVPSQDRMQAEINHLGGHHKP